MWETIKGIVKVLLFLIGLFGERNAARAKRKGELAKEMVDAFEETDRHKQASKLNNVVGGISRL